VGGVLNGCLSELAQLLEFLERHAKLSKDLVKQRGADFLTAVDWDRHAAPVRMIPPFVTSRLPRPDEA
jgi:hypothetical protein